MTIPIANPLTPKDVSPNSKVTPPCFSGQQKFPRFTISSKVTLKFPPEVAANTCTGARLNRAQFSSILTSQRSPTSCVHSTEEDRRRPPECHLPNPATLLRVCLTGWIGRRGRRDNFKMKTMKSTYIALFGVLLLVGGSFTVWAQAAQQPAAQSQPDSSTAAKAKKKKTNAGASGSQAASDSATATSTKKSTTKKAGAADTSPAATPAAPASAPAAKKATAQQAPPANSAGMVWVNPDSGIYHKPGTRWYGKTKQGKYMTEADAQKAGYKVSGKN